MKVAKEKPKVVFTPLKVFICIAAAGITLLSYIERQNDLTELRLAIPSLAKEVKALQEDNIRLQYENERFESPDHLIELSRKPEYSRMKYPNANEAIFLPRGN